MILVTVTVLVMLSMASVDEVISEGTCLQKMDVAMVFDASASIESKNFQSMKELARQIVAELDIGPDKTRVSLIHFSKFAYVDFNLTKYSSSDDVQQAINSANYTTGISEIDQGLNQAAMELLSSETGARYNVLKFLIVFTDGDFHLEELQSFVSFTDSEINVIVVASGAHIYMEELVHLVNDPTKDLFESNNPPKKVVERMLYLTEQYCSGY